MPQNQFLPFATGAGADTLVYATYATQGYLGQGFQAGVAQPYDINTVLRQLSTVVSALGQFTANNQTADVLDDGVVTNFVTKFTAALQGALASETVHYGIATGTNDALVVTASPPLVPTTTSTYQPGSFLIFKTINGTPNQTTAPTINANSIGNIAITKRGGAPLAAGDLASATWYAAFFDGVGCYLVNPTLSDLGVPSTALWHLCADGSQNPAAIVATAVPAVATRAPDLAYLVIPANPCAGATTINVGFGAQPLTRKDTTALQAGDYSAGQPLIVVDDGTQFRVIAGLKAQITGGGGLAYDANGALKLGLISNLTADNRTAPVAADILGLGRAADGAMVGVSAAKLATYILSNIVASNTFQQIAVNPVLYVDATNGLDTNPGTQGAPFQTLGKALAYGTSAYNFTSGTLTINLAAGTYASPNAIPVGSGTINIVGNTSNPGAYIISGQGVAGSSVLAANSKVNLTGLTVQNTGTIAGTVSAGQGGSMLLTNVSLVTTATGNPYPHLSANGGSMTLGGGLTISGNMGSAISAVGGGQMTIFGSVAFLNGPTFSIATAYAYILSTIIVEGGANAASMTGTVTGPRYNAMQNSIISILNGGGANAFPGTTAGTTATGAQYG